MRRRDVDAETRGQPSRAAATLAEIGTDAQHIYDFIAIRVGLRYYDRTAYWPIPARMISKSITFTQSPPITSPHLSEPTVTSPSGTCTTPTATSSPRMAVWTAKKSSSGRPSSPPTGTTKSSSRADAGIPKTQARPAAPASPRHRSRDGARRSAEQGGNCSRKKQANRTPQKALKDNELRNLLTVGRGWNIRHKGCLASAMSTLDTEVLSAIKFFAVSWRERIINQDQFFVLHEYQRGTGERQGAQPPD